MSIEITKDDTPDQGGRFRTLLTALCDHTTHLTTEICGRLGETGLSAVNPAQLIGKGNTKFPKEYLATSLLTLLKIADHIAPTFKQEPAVISINSIGDGETSQVKDDVFKSYISSLEGKVQTISAELANNTKTMAGFIESLQQMQMNMKQGTSSPSRSPKSPAMMPNTQSPAAAFVPECEPYVRFEKSCVDDNTKEALTKFLETQAGDFVSIGSTLTRDTIFFGEHEYRYTGGSHPANAMPPIIDDLLKNLKVNMTDPTAPINSCLITRYKDGTQGIKPHRDDELVIDPESEILTFSLGATRKMQFTNNSGSRTEELDLEDNSILVTSRRAQAFWEHGIEGVDGEDAGVRYSFTFRHLAPKFVNSTVLIGDSNTRVMKFGEGQGSFGVKMPGKRLEAYHVEDIPDPATIGPYRNIVIHTGVNNIKSRNRRSNGSIANELNKKCEQILQVYPKSRIYISLLLPTKLESINYRAKELNNMFTEVAHSHRNVSIIDHPRSLLADRSGCLAPKMGRHDKGSGNPLSQDALHLGREGYKVFAKSIKEGIFGKYRPRSQGQAQNGGTAVDGSQSGRSGRGQSPR
jgi:hypothetical protein